MGFQMFWVFLLLTLACSFAKEQTEAELLESMRTMQLPSIDAENYYNQEVYHYRFVPRTKRSVKFVDDSHGGTKAEAVSASIGVGLSGLSASVSAANSEGGKNTKGFFPGYGRPPIGYGNYGGGGGGYPGVGFGGGHHPGNFGGGYYPGNIGGGSSSSSAAASSSSSGGNQFGGGGGYPGGFLGVNPVSHAGSDGGGIGGVGLGGGYPGNFGGGYPSGFGGAGYPGYYGGGGQYPNGYGNGYYPGGGYYGPNNFGGGGLYPSGPGFYPQLGYGGGGFGPGGFRNSDGKDSKNEVLPKGQESNNKSSGKVSFGE